MRDRIIILFFSITAFFTSGCSYVSDMIEGAITDRATFSADATYSGGNITITWDTQSTDPNYFAGIEVYRTKYPNDEYSKYITVADRYIYPGDGLDSAITNGFMYNASDVESNPGTYFYRVAYIYWDDAVADRTYGSTQSDYQNHTNIDSISGYAEVTIP